MAHSYFVEWRLPHVGGLRNTKVASLTLHGRAH